MQVFLSRDSGLASLLVAAVCHGIGYNPRVDWNALMERLVDIDQ
jgi:hypothetical protein